MKTILIIEDNTAIREGTAEILKLSGYRVLEAEDGRSGIEIATDRSPDLILCDIMMPEIDGYGVLLRLSKQIQTYAIPFIFLTAKAERLDQRKGMALGADDYLIKPFDESELLNAIEIRLQKKQKLDLFYSRSLDHMERIALGDDRGHKELKALIADRRIRQYPKDHVLFFEGDQPQGLYLVMSGTIRTFKATPDGRELILGNHYADEFVGLHSLLSDSDHTETAITSEESAVCLLPKDVITRLPYQYPDLGNRFFKIMSNDIQQKESQLLELAYFSVRKRVANILLRLWKQRNVQNKIMITRDELAGMAGIAVETVSRTLTDFKDENLIEKSNGEVVLLAIDRLEKMKN